MTNSLPKGWTRAHLGDLFTERKESGVDGLPTMSVTMHDGLVGRNGLDRRTETTLEASSHLLVRQGDIAYNMMRMWQGACGLAAQDCIVSPAYVVLTPKPSVDPRYFVAWFKAARGLHLLWAYSHGLTDDRRRLYFDDFCQIPIDLPPLCEQRRIADALTMWDRAIGDTEAIIAAKHAQVRQTARKISQSGYASIRLDKLVTINTRSLDERTPGDFSFEYFPISTEPDEDSDAGWMTFAKAPSRARRLAKAGDVLYSTVRPLLRRVFIATDHPSAVYSTGYAVLECNDRILSSFLFFMMATPFVERQVHARLTGSGYPAISAADLSEVAVPCPDLKQQRRAADALQCLLTEADALSALSKNLRTQRRGLMEGLLTGRQRLCADTRSERHEPSH